MTRTIVLTTCGSAREARVIANDLIRKKLAACVNIIPISSCYRWKGKVVNEREWLMMIKSKSSVFPTLTRRIRALHSYELPEIISINIDNGLPRYLAWVDKELDNRV